MKDAKDVSKETPAGPEAGSRYEKPRIERRVDAAEIAREALYAGNGTPPPNGTAQE